MIRDICIIIRVYNRLDDLEECLRAINKYWKLNKYHIVLVANGKSSGYILNENIKNMTEKAVELNENAGHLKGNSQLLSEGIKYIPQSCKYTIILEADTWIFSDEIIDKYINRLEEEKKVWASSAWIDKKWSLGLDMAIIETEFVKSNSDIFNFTIHPEAYVCNYIMDKKAEFIYIKENMPVHIPKTMRKIYNAYSGRIRSFPEAKMVTHHIEDLKGGIEEKKKLANICCNEIIYENIESKSNKIEYMKIKFYIFLAKVFPKSSWINNKKRETKFN